MKNLVHLLSEESGESWVEDLEEVLKGFNNIYIKHIGKKIKGFLAKGKQYKADSMMWKVPIFFYSGFQDRYLEQRFAISYTGLVALSIKDIDENSDSKIIKKIESIPATFTWFKHLWVPAIIILVRVNSGIEDDLEARKQVKEYYQQELEIKNIEDNSRFCYCSYQPNIFINPVCKQFNVVLSGKSDESPRTEVN
jgi:hypothetical protein